MADTDRKAELQSIYDHIDDSTKTVLQNIFGETAYIEDRLKELKKYPFIEVNPKNPAQQRTTPAAKQYKELLQQYNNCIKILLGVLIKSETAEDSPLREYLNKLVNKLE